jgi:hypothetical protein
MSDIRVSASRSLFLIGICVAALLPVSGGIPFRSSRGEKAGESLALSLDARGFDEPEEASAFFLAKRSPDGKSPIDMNLYVEALVRVRDMPQYSTALARVLPSRRELGARAKSADVLGTWSWLGPGNVGGRTRALVINPNNPNVIYAGAVGGGVWKTTDGGASWAPLSDLFPNIAVTALVMDPANPSVLYAGTGEGFFNTDAIRGAGIFKTTDAGATWTRLAATNSANFYFVNRLAISPINTQRIYAATRAGIFRSVDGGASWTQVYTSNLSGGCTDLQIRTDQSTDYLFAAEGNMTQGNILRNTDAGGAGAWTVVFTEAGMGRASIAIAPSSQATVYALAAEIGTGNYHNGLHAVYRSASNGDPGTWETRVSNLSPTYLNTLLLTNPRDASWANCGVNRVVAFMNQGWYDNIIKVDPVNPNRVWAGGIDLFRSDDGGANWGLASYWWAGQGNPRLAHADHHAIVFHPSYNGSGNQTMYVGSDGGIFRTDNAASGTTATGTTGPCNTGNSGLAWTPLNNNYGVTQFYDGTVYPDGKTYFGGTQDNGTDRGTDAGGANAWNQIFSGDGGCVAVDPTNTNVLFAETTHLSLVKSTNGGGTFAAATNGITESSDNFGFIAPFAMDPGNPARLWTAGRSAWRTVDGGATWTAASAALTTGDFPATAIAVSPQDSNYVLIGRSSGFIGRTTTGLANDATTSWGQALPTDPTQVYNSWLAFDPNNKNVAYATYSTFGVPHVWKSTDAGATWTNISGSGNTGIPDVPVLSIAVDPDNGSRLYVGTDIGVFTTIDGGANWMVENTGFAAVSTESLKIVGGKLYAFTHGRGAYRVALAGGGNATVCTADAATLCLNNGRFKIQTQYTTAQGQSGAGQAVSLSGDTGYFWFFSPGNVEMVIKALNACALPPGRFWIFAGGLTNVRVVMTVTDTQNGTVKTYVNPQGTPFQVILDTDAFAACAGTPPVSGELPEGDLAGLAPLAPGLADLSGLAGARGPQDVAGPKGTPERAGAGSEAAGAVPSGQTLRVQGASDTGIAFVGNVSYAISFTSNLAELMADRIQSTRMPFDVSGPLRLALWFTTVPYAQATTGYRTATYSLGTLQGGTSLFNVDSGLVAWSRPPDGTYYVTLTLEELSSGQYYYDDFAQFQKLVTLAPPAPACTPDGATLCLNNGRFRIQTQYTTAQGQTGAGQAVSLTGDTGYYWFFSPGNVEMVVKALNACALSPGRYWIFAGGLTNVRVMMTVTDTQTGAVKTYVNPQGTPFQVILDTDAFATCP